MKNRKGKFLIFVPILILALLLLFLLPVLWIFGLGDYVDYKIQLQKINIDFVNKNKQYLQIGKENGNVVAYDFNLNRDRILYFTRAKSLGKDEWVHKVKIYTWSEKDRTPHYIDEIETSPGFYSANISSNSDNTFFVRGFDKFLVVQDDKVIAKTDNLITESDFDENEPSWQIEERKSKYCDQILREESVINEVGNIAESDSTYYADYYVIGDLYSPKSVIEGSVCRDNSEFSKKTKKVSTLINPNYMWSQYPKSPTIEDKKSMWSFDLYKLSSKCNDDCFYIYKFKYGGHEFSVNGDNIRSLFIPRSKYFTNYKEDVFLIHEGQLYKIPY